MSGTGASPEVDQPEPPPRSRVAAYYVGLILLTTAVLVAVLIAGRSKHGQPSLAGGYDVSAGAACLGPKADLTQSGQFVAISNRCAHLGCPVQANGPSGKILGMKNVIEKTKNGTVTLVPVVPAGFGCPCHGGQYDTEGNRTAGPPVRALDRYAYSIRHGHLFIGHPFSVSHVDGAGATAVIHKWTLSFPGEHVNGWEQILYPLQPPHH